MIVRRGGDEAGHEGGDGAGIILRRAADVGYSHGLLAAMLRQFLRSVYMSPTIMATSLMHDPGPGNPTSDRAVGLPHDCTSTCALDVERLSPTRIGRVRGSMRNGYTAGVICEKVARYAERIHHPDRLMKPMRRTGPKGSRQFAEISWNDALDIVAEAVHRQGRQHGSETIWPYYYAGTMGLVQRDGINRLRNAMNIRASWGRSA